MSELRDGFYWVRPHDSGADWQVAERSEGAWLLTGSEEPLGDAQIAEVSPRRLSEPVKMPIGDSFGH